jgi:hypothetical protein
MDSTPPGGGATATVAILLLLLVIGVSGAAGVAGAQASVIYVDAGPDDPACPTTPYATIQDAVDDATAGDTVVVCDGTYNETVTVDEELRLVANDGSDVVLDGDTLPAGSTAITVEASAAGSVVDGFDATGFDTVVSLSNAGDTVVRDLVANDSETGVAVSASGTATVSNVTVRDVALDGVSTGVLVSTDDDAALSDVNVYRNVVNASATGVLIEGNSSVPVSDVGVRQNLVANATTAGVRTTSATDPTGVRVTRNFLRDNDPYGIQNENGGGTLTAWLNHWGDDSGPGSLGTTVTDPVTGEPADGSGDNVSENVRFDPWLGSAACADPQLQSVTDRTFEFFEEEVSLSQLQPVCLWERAALPLRADDDDAATSVRNLQAFVRTAGAGDVPINRPRLSAYQRGESFDLRFESTIGAGVSRFADAETQLLVVRGEEASTDFEVGLDNSTGEGQLSVDAASVRVVDTPALDSDGELNYSFTPPSAGDYTFVLVRNDFGSGVSVDGDEIRVDGGITVVGVESVPVQNEEASADTTEPSYPAGSNVTFLLDSELRDGRTNHTVVLYNDTRFADSTATIEVDGNLSESLTGDVSSGEVTVEHSIRSLNGFILADVGVSALGVEVTAQNRSGRVDPSPLIDSATSEFGLSDQATVTTTDDATLLNGSVVVVQGDSDTTVDVPTFRNFSTGSYRYVYVSQRGSAVSSATGTVDLTTPTPTPTPTATPDGDDGDGGDGGAGGGGGGGGGVGAAGEVEIETTELLNESVTTDEAVVVRVDLANVDPASGRISLELTADGDVVAERTVSVAASSERIVYVRATLDSPGEYDIALNGEELGTVTVTEAAETPTRTPEDGVTPTPGDTPEVTDTVEGTPTDGVTPTTPPAGPDGPTGTELLVGFVLVLGLLAAVGVAVYLLPQ